MINEYENLLGALYKDNESPVTEELLMKVFPLLYRVATIENYNVEKIYKLTISLITSRELMDKLDLGNGSISEKSNIIQAYVRVCMIHPISLRSFYFKCLVTRHTNINLKDFLVKNE